MRGQLNLSPSLFKNENCGEEEVGFPSFYSSAAQGAGYIKSSYILNYFGDRGFFLACGGIKPL